MGDRGAAGAAEVRPAAPVARAVATSVAGVAEGPAQAQAMLKQVRRRCLLVTSESPLLTVSSLHHDVVLSLVVGLVVW